MTELQLKNKGFDFVKEYKHDRFVTRRYRKGIIEFEFTYEGNKQMSADVTIDEIIGMKVNENELEQLDKILNKNA